MMLSTVLQILADGDLPLDLRALAPYLGIPGTMMAIALWAVYSGKFITLREANSIKDSASKEVQMAKDAVIRIEKEWQDRYEELKTEAQARLLELKTEKDMWRDAALKNLQLAEKSVSTARMATDRLPLEVGKEG